MLVGIESSWMAIPGRASLFRCGERFPLLLLLPLMFCVYDLLLLPWLFAVMHLLVTIIVANSRVWGFPSGRYLFVANCGRSWTLMLQTSMEICESLRQHSFQWTEIAMSVSIGVQWSLCTVRVLHRDMSKLEATYWNFHWREIAMSVRIWMWMESLHSQGFAWKCVKAWSNIL
jgi:hypothetical protein